jgi:hypothetical protein
MTLAFYCMQTWLLAAIACATADVDALACTMGKIIVSSDFWGLFIEN